MTAMTVEGDDMRTTSAVDVAGGSAPLRVEQPPPWRSSEILLLALIVLIGGIVRFHHISTHSFWIDEFFTVEIVNGTGMAGSFLVPQNIVLDPPPDPTAMRPVRG